MENKYAKEILLRYQNGTASQEEKAQVEEWMLFGKFPEATISEKKIVSDLLHISSKLPLHSTPKVISLWKKIIVAAAILLVASVTKLFCSARP